ncbi:Protein 4.1, partial [Ilyodon furcidens]
MFMHSNVLSHFNSYCSYMDIGTVEVILSCLQPDFIPFPYFSQKRPKRLEGETIYIRHSNLMLEDLDKTQTEIMRHHTSLSELKRSFMESVPEPRPSEWDKRLSTNSPLRTVCLNGQLQPA